MVPETKHLGFLPELPRAVLRGPEQRGESRLSVRRCGLGYGKDFVIRAREV